MNNAHQKKKSLGQHFLHNQSVIEEIVSCIDVSNTYIVEVWPGDGALTDMILDRWPQALDLIELDDDLIPKLQETYGNNNKVSLHHRDVLKTDIWEGKDISIQGDYLLFGNIPYYITSSIILHFLYKVSHQPTGMVLMMQKEVADKIVQSDGKGSSLSTLCWLKCDAIKKVCNVWAGSFSPPPKVDSAVLHFRVKRDPSPVDTQSMRLIEAAFREKRKKLLNNLKKGYRLTGGRTWNDIFQKLNLDENIRAEDVELQVWRDMMDLI